MVLRNSKLDGEHTNRLKKCFFFNFRHKLRFGARSGRRNSIVQLGRFILSEAKKLFFYTHVQHYTCTLVELGIGFVADR